MNGQQARYPWIVGVVLAVLWAPMPAVAFQAGAALGGRVTSEQAIKAPAEAFERFLAQSQMAEVSAAYAIVDELGYSGADIDVAACREHAQKLREAVDRVPVSLAIQHAAMLCAEATGDSASADASLAVAGALAKAALAQASGFGSARPIRVVSPVDAYALAHISGLELRYAYYGDRNPKRYFPMVLALWDPASKSEKHIAFDFIDAAYRLSRTEPYFGFPVLRSQLVATYLNEQAKAGIVMAVDMKALRHAVESAEPKEKVDRLRAAAQAGGVQAAQGWLVICVKTPFPGCADGLADALMPEAEKEHAWPMTLLAMVYAEGVGVERDPAAAEKLLAAASKRWDKDGATLAYVDLWRGLHQRPLPKPLLEKLARAEAMGNANVRALLTGLKTFSDDKPELSEDELRYLARPDINGIGFGYSMLATYYMGRDKDSEKTKWVTKAAEAGDPWAQADYAWMLDAGEGVPKDEAAAKRWAAESAHGGSAWGMRMMSRYSRSDRRWTDAEKWLLVAAAEGDGQAMLDLGQLYEFERPGVSAKADGAAPYYRAVADHDSDAEIGAVARRRLAAMALAGRGMPKDSKQAQRWLLQDAEKGDHISEARLGLGYLNGDFGPPDEAEGRRWIDRALKAKESSVFADYGYWLYYKKKTPESQQQAIDLWEQGLAVEDAFTANNLAWVRCTSPDERIFDPARGVAAAEKLGSPADLDPSTLDTYAACQAAAGRFDEAAKQQAKVIELTANQGKELGGAAAAQIEENMKEFRSRLAQYNAKQRYIETARE